jgi:c-di-GMP-binding flagellar brake protein YcgR
MTTQKGHRKDRRTAHRVEVLGDLCLEVLNERVKIRGDTMNISHNGINFFSQSELPLFREVDVSLKLPRGHSRRPAKVHCAGVVIRCVRRVSPFWEISLFFLDISTADKRKIQHYIDSVYGRKLLFTR